MLRVSILIPCRNEEMSISACIDSCLNQTYKNYEIIVVNDGSTDSTRKILNKYKSKIKIINNYPASGNKSYAQQIGLKKVTGDIFVSTDADTILDKNFVKNIVKNFKSKKVVAASGYVKSMKYNWITACREFDYIIGQNIHKNAQDILGFLLVIPGAAGAFRTKFFKENIKFDHDTLTEDLDFTYKIHKSGYKIKFDRSAIVNTQDPSDIRSYIYQMKRWFGGGWQNLRKHLEPKLFKNSNIALELGLIYIEGLIFSILMLFSPLISLKFFYYSILLTSALIIIQSIYVFKVSRRKDILFVPFYYIFFSYINAVIFVQQFIVEFLFNSRKMVWISPERVEL